MATKFTFNNQVVELPGAYSRFISGVTNPALSLSFGNILLIDTGSNPDFGAGAGISGELASGDTAVYESDDIRSFRDAIGGGIFWDIAAHLFQPNGPGGGNGVSKIYYTRAAATTAAQVTIDFTAGANGGTSVIKVRNEGTVGNGVQGDETLATTTYTVTATGADGDTHNLEVDEGSGSIIISTFDKTATETTTDDIAAQLVANISLGYTAVQNGSDIIVTARPSTGQELADDWNSFATAYTVTGAATGTSSPFTGGVAGTELTRGYAVTMSAGIEDANKYFVQFWRGSFRGLDENGFPWDEKSEVDTVATLVATSPEFDNIADLHAWMEQNQDFGSIFVLSSKTVVGDGSVVNADLLANANNNLFAGGTITYDTSHIDTILDQVQRLDYSLILCDQYGDNAQSADNGKFLAHVTDGDTFGDKLLIIGGGADASKFSEGVTNSSIETAKFYNSDRVQVVHGSPLKSSNLVAQGFVDRTPLHSAAVYCGLAAGLEPQVPTTFKSVRIDGLKHKATVKQEKQALRKGVVLLKVDAGVFSVLQGVTSIQNNDFLLNTDGTTHSFQVRRIMAQINRELVVNAVNQLLKNPNGTNRNTLSVNDLKTFTEGYLKSRTATTTLDNLIISFRNVTIELDNDAYKVSYDVILNSEITKLFFTGTVFLEF